MRGSQLHEWTHIIATECRFNALPIRTFFFVFCVMLCVFFLSSFFLLSRSLSFFLAVNVNMSITIHPIAERVIISRILSACWFYTLTINFSFVLCQWNMQFHMHNDICCCCCVQAPLSLFFPVRFKWSQLNAINDI